MIKDIDNIFYFLSKTEIDKIKDKYKDTKLSKDEVIKEICKDYNLDYEKTIRRNNLDKDITNVSLLISNFIRDIIKLFRKTVYNRKLESILESIVKLIVFIIIIMVIKIPFIGIDYLVKYFSNMLFYPFQYSIRYISSLFVSLIYMLICITCGLKLFGNYRGIEKKIIDENKIKSVDEEYKYLDKLIRIVIYLAVLIPLFILLIVCIILFILSVYIVITGVKLIGVSIIFLGLIMILISVIKLFRDGLNNKKDSRLLKLSVSSLVFIFGCLYTVYNFSTFKTNEDFNYSEMDTVTDSLELKLDDINTKVLVRNGNYELVKDSTLQDNNIRIEATYYDDYVDILYGQEKIGEINVLRFSPISDDNIDYFKFFNVVHKDLKKGYIFNYSDVKKINIKVYANEEVISKIEENK